MLKLFVNYLILLIVIRMQSLQAVWMHRSGFLIPWTSYWIELFPDIIAPG